jgi:hypothetical protein
MIMYRAAEMAATAAISAVLAVQHRLLLAKLVTVARLSTKLKQFVAKYVDRNSTRYRRQIKERTVRLPMTILTAKSSRGLRKAVPMQRS